MSEKKIVWCCHSDVIRVIQAYCITQSVTNWRCGTRQGGSDKMLRSIATRKSLAAIFPTSNLNAFQCICSGKHGRPEQHLLRTYSSWFNRVAHFKRDRRSRLVPHAHTSIKQKSTEHSTFEWWWKGHSGYCVHRLTAVTSRVFMSANPGEMDLTQVSDLEFWLQWLFHCTFPCHRLLLFFLSSGAMDCSKRPHRVALLDSVFLHLIWPFFNLIW